MEILICGGIGMGAQEALAMAGISVIPGVEGKVEPVLIDFFTGNLKISGEASCDHHKHGEEGCGEGHCGEDGCGSGCTGGCGH